ncbi:MAG: DUF308 domain-containing protein [Huintestinicola sp.]|uniref:DUF308 domain-containing protein n=1 Tax=Huintestinicola sp. TaxID=2981661 RepID=UPI003EFD4EC9
MGIFGSSSAADRKKMVFLLLWLISGIGMVIVGIMAVINREKAIGAISGFLGVCALITGVITLILRISQVKRLGKRNIGFDIVIWLALGFLLLNTGLLNKLGKLVFIIGGITLICEGVRAFAACQRNKDEKEWYIPRMIFSGVFVVLGIIVVVNAEKIFTHLIPLAVGIYFIIHGTELLYEWIGRAKHFYYFRGTE